MRKTGNGNHSIPMGPQEASWVMRRDNLSKRGTHRAVSASAVALQTRKASESDLFGQMRDSRWSSNPMTSIRPFQV